MRIALCLRGISYLENYRHSRNTIPYHTLNFKNTGPSIKKCIIEPFEQQGDQVDVYFATYKSPCEQELIDFYKPVNVYFTDYKDLGDSYYHHGINILNQHSICIQLYKHTEQQQGFKYDQVIITRFDLYFYQNILDIGIDYTLVNIPFYHHHGERHIFSSEDNFLMYPGSKTDIVLQSIINIQHNMYNNDLQLWRTSHNIADFILEKGETIKYLFGEKGDGPYDYPFYKFARHIFGPKKEIKSIEESLNIPMNRIYHFKEEKEHNSGIYYNLKKGFSISPL